MFNLASSFSLLPNAEFRGLAMQKVQVTANGVRRHLNRYKPKHAIAEFLWNGFDAGASKVELQFRENEIGHLESLVIRDNGHGIQGTRLNRKFKPFLESEKEVDPNAQRVTSSVHGKNGVGRLTFFTFAATAVWLTTYEQGGKRYSYEIEISGENLEAFRSTKPAPSSSPLGTSVEFHGIYGITAHDLTTEIGHYLSREFAWYLELNSPNKRLLVNGNEFDYSGVVGEREKVDLSIDGHDFSLNYVRWNQKLNDEYSRYYVLDSNNEEKFTYTTTLNNKGDQFYHSLFIRSEFFDSFDGNPNPNQSMFRDLPEEQTYRELLTKVEIFLRQKRKPFLKEMVDVVIADLEQTDSFPDFGKNEWDKIREEGLKNVIGELFQLEPKIFSDLNAQQKKTFVHLLNLVMDSGERDALMEIIDQVVNLTSNEREQLAATLKITSLSNVIRTIKLIEDRYKVVAEMKELVFNKELKATEVHHLQKVVESHYWIFGEQYHLVTAAEPKFEEALRRFVQQVRGKESHSKIDHPEKLGEMDIFMIRQQVVDNNKMVKSVCVELKHPEINLGKKQLSRLEDYRDVVLKADEFNGKNIFWEFHLIGNGFDGSEYIERIIESNKGHGEKSLTFSIVNCKMYAKTWSEVFVDFELRHNFLLERLRLERDKLALEQQSADEIVANVRTSSAAMEAPLV